MANQPAPPFAEDTGLPSDVEVAGDAVEAIGTARRHHGDTFAI